MNYGTSLMTTELAAWSRAQQEAEGERLNALCANPLPPSTVALSAAVGGVIPGVMLGALIGLLGGDAGKGALVGMGAGALTGGALGMMAHRKATALCAGWTP
jgi:predicted lipid-binding transport protein (Tim44 family)